jgi:hypothetical protein
MEGLAARTGFLRSNQNAGGGWGYFPGKKSWLEPSFYAAMALWAEGDAAAAGRVWTLLRSWQNADGGFRPNAQPGSSTWCTALAVLLGLELGEEGAAVRGGVRWLMDTAGAESGPLNRFLRRFGAMPAGRQVEHRGWPWRPGTTSWVEPTALAMVALRRIALRRPEAAIAKRIRTAERMLMSVRCSDGGWNYGSPGALGVDLPSYPETTALALTGLQSSAPPQAWERARARIAEAGVSPLAHAWLTVALRLGGDTPAERLPRWDSADVLLCGVQCLGGPEGHWRRLRGGVL